MSEVQVPPKDHCPICCQLVYVGTPHRCARDAWYTLKEPPVSIFPDFTKAATLDAGSRAPWQCPGCKTFHAPWIDACRCQTLGVQITPTSVQSRNG